MAWSRCALAAALAAASLLSGCIFGPEDKGETPPRVPEYRSLTDKENVVHNLLESYEWCNIERYEELLHADYVWHNRADDVIEGKVPTAFYTRDQDIASTGNLFKARLGTHPDSMVVVKRLKLKILSAPWQDVAELGGVPCGDCWETTRPYEIMVETPAMTIVATGLVRLVVVPVADGTAKLYKLRRADDLVD